MAEIFFRTLTDMTLETSAPYPKGITSAVFKDRSEQLEHC